MILVLPYVVTILTLFALFLILAPFVRSKKEREELVSKIHERLRRSITNPLLEPLAHNAWESEAVFNPAALLHDGRIHLLYRAIGADGVSRLGYASSADGITFNERLPYPVFQIKSPKQQKKLTQRRKTFDPHTYSSGGSWGGCEDPRMVAIDEHVYLTFNAFDGWDYIRVAAVSLPLADFGRKYWNWSRPLMLSPEGEVQKSWMLFPEKIDGKYAVLHSVTPHVQVDYVDRLEDLDAGSVRINSIFKKERRREWDTWLRGPGSPPIKTDAGWLVLYHAITDQEPDRYKLGAMLLDLEDPSKVLVRSSAPLLAPDMHYENHSKPGVVYTCGAVVKDENLFVYYGGGDRHVCVAHAPLQKLLDDLQQGATPHLHGQEVVMA